MVRESKISSGKMRVRLEVSFDVPVGATRDQCAEYVLDAMRGWYLVAEGGTVMEDLSRDSVRVVRCTGRTNHDSTRKTIK